MTPGRFRVLTAALATTFVALLLDNLVAVPGLVYQPSAVRYGWPITWPAEIHDADDWRPKAAAINVFFGVAALCGAAACSVLLLSSQPSRWPRCFAGGALTLTFLLLLGANDLGFVHPLYGVQFGREADIANACLFLRLQGLCLSVWPPILCVLVAEMIAGRPQTRVTLRGLLYLTVYAALVLSVDHAIVALRRDGPSASAIYEKAGGGWNEQPNDEAINIRPIGVFGGMVLSVLPIALFAYVECRRRVADISATDSWLAAAVFTLPPAAVYALLRLRIRGNLDSEVFLSASLCGVYLSLMGTAYAVCFRSPATPTAA